MQLVQTDICPVEPVAVTDLGIVPATIACDRSQTMFAQRDVGLQRNAPAFFLGRGDEVLTNVTRIRTIKASTRKRESAGIGWRRADNFCTAIVIGFAVIAAQCQHDVFTNISLNCTTNTVMLITIDLFASGQVVDVAVIASVKSGEARADVGAQRQVHRRTAAIFGLREE